MTSEHLNSAALLPTVHEPGTFAWAEEVVECINTAWRTRETGEQGFFAAVRAAVTHRIWETLSPPPPDEPYTSLANLIRRTAEPGQAENMQIAVRLSGILEASPALAAEAPALAPTLSAPFALSDPALPAGVSLVDVMAALADAAPPDPPAPRISAAQRKRERLERTRPDLLDAVQTGDLTLKQAYVEAGIEKQVSPLDRLQKLWHTLSEEERDRFLGWLKQELQAEQVREYHEDVYGEDA